MSDKKDLDLDDLPARAREIDAEEAGEIAGGFRQGTNMKKRAMMAAALERKKPGGATDAGVGTGTPAPTGITDREGFKASLKRPGRRRL